MKWLNYYIKNVGSTLLKDKTYTLTTKPVGVIDPRDFRTKAFANRFRMFSHGEGLGEYLETLLTEENAWAVKWKLGRLINHQLVDMGDMYELQVTTDAVDSVYALIAWKKHTHFYDYANISNWKEYLTTVEINGSIKRKYTILDTQPLFRNPYKINNSGPLGLTNGYYSVSDFYYYAYNRYL